MLRKSGLFDPDAMLKPFVDRRRSSLVPSKTLFHKTQRFSSLVKLQFEKIQTFYGPIYSLHV